MAADATQADVFTAANIVLAQLQTDINTVLNYQSVTTQGIAALAQAAASNAADARNLVAQDLAVTQHDDADILATLRNGVIDRIIALAQLTREDSIATERAVNTFVADRSAALGAQIGNAAALIMNGVDALLVEIRGRQQAELEQLFAVETRTESELRPVVRDEVATGNARVLAAITGGSVEVGSEVAGVAQVLRNLNDPNVSAVVKLMQTMAQAQRDGAAFDVAFLEPMVATLVGDIAGTHEALRADNPGGIAGLIAKLQAFFEANAQQRSDELKDIMRRAGVVPPEGEVTVQLATMPSGGALAKWLLTAWGGANIANELGKEFVGVDALEVAREHVPFVTEAAGKFAEVAGHALMATIEGSHGAMKTVIRSGADLIFGEMESSLDALGEVTPDNVMGHAASILSIAGAWGMTAHMVAVAKEKSHHTKHLGFPQLAAFLADMASFGVVARDTFGAQIAAALRSPAERHARRRFRGELPDVAAFLDAFYAGLTDEEEFHDYFAQRGWTDEAIADHSLTAYRKASPREMAMVFEDGELDDAWGLYMLQRHGFNDDDAARLLSGVRSRAQKGPRQAFLAAVEANAADGLLSDDTATALLTSAGVGTDTIRLILAAVTHKRLKTDGDKLKTLYEAQAADGILTDEDLKAALATLGYDAREQNAAALRARVRRGTKLFTEAATDTKAAIRRAQIASVTALREQFKRELITVEQLRAGLLSAGVAVAEVDSIVYLAASELPPVPEREKVLTAARQAQADRELAQKAVLAQQHTAAITFDESVARQVALGVSQRDAFLAAQLEAAKLTRSPTGTKRTAETTAALEARTAATDAALDLFRVGVYQRPQLVDALSKAGHLANAAAAIADKEIARRQAQELRAVASQNASDLRKQRQAIIDAALKAFEAGRIDDHGLLANLMAAGHSAATAQALVNDAITKRDIKAGRAPHATKTTASSGF